MERYIGIDAHKASSTVCVLGPSGRVLQEIVVETNARALIAAIARVPTKRHLCLEESALSEWLYETLERHVDSIRVVQAEPNPSNKSDKRDARWLADVVRLNVRTTTVFKACQRYRGLREAMRTYQLTVADVTSAKNQVTALFGSRAIDVEKPQLYDRTTRAKWIAKLPTAFRTRASLLGRRLDAALALHSDVQAWVEEEAKQVSEVRRLMTAPGIGLIRAATIVAVVVTPHRFRTLRQFWSYCGFAVVSQSTSDWRRDNASWARRREAVRTRGLNSNRNPLLKNALKGAAKTVVTQMPDHPLTTGYHSMIERGLDRSLALLTIARRIAAILLAMWKNQEDYNTSRTKQPQNAA